MERVRTDVPDDEPETLDQWAMEGSEADVLDQAPPDRRDGAAGRGLPGHRCARSRRLGAIDRGAPRRRGPPRLTRRTVPESGDRPAQPGQRRSVALAASPSPCRRRPWPSPRPCRSCLLASSRRRRSGRRRLPLTRPFASSLSPAMMPPCESWGSVAESLDSARRRTASCPALRRPKPRRLTSPVEGYCSPMAMLTRVLDDEPVRRFDDYARGGRRPSAGHRRRSSLPATSSASSPLPACAAGAEPASRPGSSGAPWQRTRRGRHRSPSSSTRRRASPGRSRIAEIIRRNPYRVLEGALVAAYAMDSPARGRGDQGIVHDRDRAAGLGDRRDAGAAGIATDITIDVVRGPDEYLFGEETALLEVVDGRHPFPRAVPPYRWGVEPHDDTPALVDNVETLANVPGIIAEGPEWFRRRNAGVAWDDRVHGERRHRAPRRRRVRDGHAPGGGDRNGRPRPARGPPRRRGDARHGQRHAPRRPARHADELRGDGQRRHGPWDGRDHRLRRQPRSARRRPAVSHFLAIESCGQCEPCKSTARRSPPVFAIW